MNANLTRTATDVCIDDFGPFPALVADWMRWNGWACPVFTLDTVRDIAARLQADIDTYGPTDMNWIIIDADGVWEGCDAYRDGYTDPRGDKLEPIVIDGVDYYAAGDAWCWYETTNN